MTEHKNASDGGEHVRSTVWSGWERCGTSCDVRATAQRVCSRWRTEHHCGQLVLRAGAGDPVRSTNGVAWRVAGAAGVEWWEREAPRRETGAGGNQIGCRRSRAVARVVRLRVTGALELLLRRWDAGDSTNFFAPAAAIPCVARSCHAEKMSRRRRARAKHALKLDRCQRKYKFSIDLHHH